MIRVPLPIAKQKEAVMPDVLILSAARTPIGKYLGSLAELTAPQLGGRKPDIGAGCFFGRMLTA